MVEVVCDNCGMIFVKKGGRARVFKHNFCSSKCLHAYQKKFPPNPGNKWFGEMARERFTKWNKITVAEAGLWLTWYKNMPALVDAAKKAGHTPSFLTKVLKHHFPAEYELIHELKAKPFTRYHNGRAFEYRVKKYYASMGYYVLRSAGSHSPVDLVALKHGVVLLLQCKTRGVFTTAGEKERLIELANTCGVKAVLVSREKMQPYELKIRYLN